MFKKQKYINNDNNNIDPKRIQSLFNNIKSWWSSILKNPQKINSSNYDVLEKLNLTNPNNISLWGKKFIWTVAPLTALALGINYYPRFSQNVGDKLVKLRTRLIKLLSKISKNENITTQVEKLKDSLNSINSRNNSQLENLKQDIGKTVSLVEDDHKTPTHENTPVQPEKAKNSLIRTHSKNSPPIENLKQKTDETVSLVEDENKISTYENIPVKLEKVKNSLNRINSKNSPQLENLKQEIDETVSYTFKQYKIISENLKKNISEYISNKKTCKNQNKHLIDIGNITIYFARQISIYHTLFFLLKSKVHIEKSKLEKTRKKLISNINEMVSTISSNIEIDKFPFSDAMKKYNIKYIYHLLLIPFNSKYSLYELLYGNYDSLFEHDNQTENVNNFIQEVCTIYNQLKEFYATYIPNLKLDNNNDDDGNKCLLNNIKKLSDSMLPIAENLYSIVVQHVISKHNLNYPDKKIEFKFNNCATNKQ
jgi:hypothetical protein